jgi:hypothetical protein
MRIYFSGGEIFLYVFASCFEDDVELFRLCMEKLLYLGFGFQGLEGWICSGLGFLVFAWVVLRVLKDPRKVRRMPGKRGIRWGNGRVLPAEDLVDVHCQVLYLRNL